MAERLSLGIIPGAGWRASEIKQTVRKRGFAVSPAISIYQSATGALIAHSELGDQV